MTKQKLQRFSELDTFPNVFGKSGNLSGIKPQDYFKLNQPIILELGCGRGEYTLSLAQHFPSRNIIGVDLKGSRLWRGAKTALEMKLENAAFLHTNISFLKDYFSNGEVSEIWITFPDPYPKRRKENSRLTSPNFLKIYKGIMLINNKVHLKTDSDTLFNYSLKIVNKMNYKVHRMSFDVHNDFPNDEVLTNLTTYEEKHLKQGLKIKYFCFTI